MKILVIDDEPFALRLVTRQLRTLGFTDVTTHVHAATAVRALEHDATCADLILLDLQMPDMDGIEFVRHLARLRYAGGLVLFSGEDQRIVRTASTLARAYTLEVRGLLSKPADLAQLRALLEAPVAEPKAPAHSKQKLYGPHEIEAAIARGELVNHYQPQVEFASGTVVGVETLVRWNHPTDGLVLPEQFVSVAEEHGLIHQLTRLVLAEALHQTRRWHDEGSPIVVAVNASMESFTALDFPEFIEGALRSAGVANRHLVLEVTESRLAVDDVMALDIFTRLRLKHIGLSIDDFGTGHSSLAQLRKIPFDELKIDQGFVHGADRDPSSHAIVDASLGMARQLGLTTVAEGIEDYADWRHLRRLGCEVGQGFFIARPMPADTFNAWHRGWQKHLTALIPE